MAFIPIPIIIPRPESEMSCFLKSEYEIKREYEERKRAELIEQKELERKALEKREKVKSKKLKKINKQVRKNGFTVSDFRAIYDYSFRAVYGQALTGKRLKKIKKIHDQMEKYDIFTSDLDIYAQEEKSRKQNVELNQSSNYKVDVSLSIATCLNNNNSESSYSLEQLRTLRDMLTDTSNNQQQQYEPSLVKTKRR